MKLERIINIIKIANLLFLILIIMEKKDVDNKVKVYKVSKKLYIQIFNNMFVTNLINGFFQY
jgi:hypothetical protein